MADKYSFGNLNPILNDPSKSELPDGEFSDDSSMFEHVKHDGIKKGLYMPDAFAGTNRFKAIVISSPQKIDESKLKAWLDKKLPIPKDAFGFKIRIPELHAMLPNPCQMGVSLQQSTPEQIPATIRRVIQLHPTCFSKQIWGTGQTIQDPPPVGAIVWIEFEKGPDGGRLQNPMFDELIRSPAAGASDSVCSLISPAQEFSKQAIGGGSSGGGGAGSSFGSPSTSDVLTEGGAKLETGEQGNYPDLDVDWIPAYYGTGERRYDVNPFKGAIVTDSKGENVGWTDANYTKKTSRTVERICLHTTEGSTSHQPTWGKGSEWPSQRVANLFAKAGRGGSVHFNVDGHGHITQGVGVVNKAWGNNNWNYNSINIEQCGKAATTRKAWLEDQYYNSCLKHAAKLVATLCNKYNIIPVYNDTIIGHAHVPDQTHWDPGCPKRAGGDTKDQPIWENPDELTDPSLCDGYPWDELIRLVKVNLDAKNFIPDVSESGILTSSTNQPG